GDVVDLVTGQTQIIDELAWFKSVTFENFLFVVVGFLQFVANLHVGVDELENVFIAAQDQNFHSGLFPLKRERRDQIIGLKAVFLHTRQSPRLSKLLGERKLRDERAVDLDARRLVGHILQMAERRSGGVKANAHIIGLFLL